MTTPRPDNLVKGQDPSMWDLTHTARCPYWTLGEDDADTAFGPDERTRSTFGQLPDCIRTLAATTREKRQTPSSQRTQGDE